MVEIEWDGVEMPNSTRRALRERLRTLASEVDPDGRGRLSVEILGDGALYHVIVRGRNASGPLGVEARHPDLPRAIERALSMALLDVREGG